ncbi:54S ribosomal protein MRP49, mitochondrial [Smittium culicis]|uniref:54S ribosomal protein MRP49, mitochondrial n=1 Tax=Smittium culicis TaxID=133412 RepID=A0A1R1X0V5_9FUNG|nr:54S ribosomal protein MRP49, mitochondrial [Smittium culicis]
MSKYVQLVQALESGIASVKFEKPVSRITLNFCQKTRAHGARHFWRKNIPQLQFMNPNVKFDVKLSQEKIKPSIELALPSGAKTLDITGLSSQDVVKKLLSSL